MTMATVTYKRRMFPGQLLKARPLVSSWGPTRIDLKSKMPETGQSGNFSGFYFSFFYTHIFF
jgi:hypothetical protein